MNEYFIIFFYYASLNIMLNQTHVIDLGDSIPEFDISLTNVTFSKMSKAVIWKSTKNKSSLP